MKTSRLRQEFIEHLTLKGYSVRTIQSYVGAVAQLARYYDRSPARLNAQEVRAYLYELHKAGRSKSTLNVVISGLRSFYDEVLHRPEICDKRRLPRPRNDVRRPQAYSVEEVHRLLECGFTSPKYRIFFMTLYGAGLRLNEACHLKPEHLDVGRMLVRVEQGKGRKDRYTILPKHLLEELRRYWQMYRPRYWLFPSARDERKPICDRAVQRAFQDALRRAKLPCKGGVHTLRHSFATHLTEGRAQLHIVKELMGHTSMSTTAGYLHISRQTMDPIQSPLDTMDWNAPAKL
jgi:site-specific recombinase XerD